MRPCCRVGGAIRWKYPPSDKKPLRQYNCYGYRRAVGPLPPIISSLMIADRFSSWFADAVQLREMLRSDVNRRAETPEACPRLLYAPAYVLHSSIVGTMAPLLVWPEPKPTHPAVSVHAAYVICSLCHLRLLVPSPHGERLAIQNTFRTHRHLPTACPFRVKS